MPIRSIWTPLLLESAFRGSLSTSDRREMTTRLAWLSEPRSLHSNIETYVTITPASAFDALYFVETLRLRGLENLD